MDEQIVIAVLAGTTRVQRRSIIAAKWIAEFGRQQPGVEIIFVDPTELYFPGDGNDPEGKDPRYSEITARADAFFIVTPEYNHSFPGTLKRMLDSELANYNHKPVAFAGVSDGNWFMDAVNRELPRFEAELIELGQPGVDLVFRGIARDLARDLDDEQPPRRP